MGGVPTDMTEDLATGAASRPRVQLHSNWARLGCAIALAAALIAITGCGSSPPAYCAQRTSLQNSVNGLTNLNASSGVSGLKSQVEKIENEASKVVSSAKSDFPSETSAIKNSVNALKGSIAALSSSPTAAQIDSVTQKASSVVTSVDSFHAATNSKCS
jgi:hypothetical protein